VYFELTADGKVDIINMSRSSGDQTADDAAIRAVRKTLFETLPDGVKNLLVNARFDTMKSGSFAPAPVGRSSSRPMAHA
jgi:TonB family protein